MLIPDPDNRTGCLPVPFFILIGPIILIGGLSGARGRRRLVQSIVGSLIVLLGNVLMLQSLVLGLAVVALGIYVVFMKRNEFGE